MMLTIVSFGGTIGQKRATIWQLCEDLFIEQDMTLWQYMGESYSLCSEPNVPIKTQFTV